MKEVYYLVINDWKICSVEIESPEWLFLPTYFPRKWFHSLFQRAFRRHLNSKTVIKV